MLVMIDEFKLIMITLCDGQLIRVRECRTCRRISQCHGNNRGIDLRRVGHIRVVTGFALLRSYFVDGVSMLAYIVLIVVDLGRRPNDVFRIAVRISGCGTGHHNGIAFLHLEAEGFAFLHLAAFQSLECFRRPVTDSMEIVYHANCTGIARSDNEFSILLRAFSNVHSHSHISSNCLHTVIRDAIVVSIGLSSVYLMDYIGMITQVFQSVFYLFRIPDHIHRSSVSAGSRGTGHDESVAFLDREGEGLALFHVTTVQRLGHFRYPFTGRFISVRNQLVGLAIVCVRILISNTVDIQACLIVSRIATIVLLVPAYYYLNLFGRGIVNHRIVITVGVFLFGDGEVVSACAIQRHFREATIDTLFVGICIRPFSSGGDIQCLGLNGIHRQYGGVQLLERVGQILIGQFQVELEGERLHGVAGEQLLNVELYLHAALVGDLDLLKPGSLARSRDLQHECGRITDGACLGASGLRISGDGHILVKAFGRSGLFDDVLSPPVEAGDVDLAVFVSNQLGLGAGTIEVVDVHSAIKIKGARIAAGSCGRLKRTKHLKLRTLDRGIVFRCYLGDLKVTHHSEADILALINLVGEQDEERSGLEGCCTGSLGRLLKEVAVLGMRIAGGNGRRVIGNVVFVASPDQLVNALSIADAGIQCIVGRIIALQGGNVEGRKVRIFRMIVQRRLVVQGRAQAVELEVHDGLVVPVAAG